MCKVCQILSLLITVKQKHGSPSPGWWATTPVVITVSGAPAPRRGSPAGATAFLTVGQLHSDPATTQRPVKQAYIVTHCGCGELSQC